MNFLKAFAVTLLIFTGSLSALAQTNEDKQLSLDSGTIDDQFEYVIQKSSSWKDERGQSYKVIKSFWLYELKAHTIDTLKAFQKDLNDTQAIVNNQAKEITDLKTNLSETQDKLDKTNTEKDSMSLFGIQMSKIGYNALMWTIIAGLLALLLFFIYKFKNSNTVTKQARQSLLEVEEEFEEHRKTALEREQKVRRQLQDEINKQKAAKNSK